MTRTVVSPRVSYDGSGSTGPYSVPFYFRANSHVKAYLIDSAGASTLLAEGTGYTLTGGPSSGSLTTTDTVDTGETLVIYRETPIEQDKSILSGGTFSSTTVMGMSDVATDILQELDARIDRGGLPLSLKDTDDATIAGKYLKFNAAGTALEVAESLDVSALVPGVNCLVVATSSITLSGAQTIDTVGVVAGNIVLVQNQTTKSENGPYVVAAGAWTRHADHDDTDGLQALTAFGVTSGSDANKGIWVQLVKDPVIGTSDIVFNKLAGTVGVTGVNIGSGGTINFNSGDVVLTHSTNALAMTGGQLSITYNGGATSEPLRLVNSTDNASVQVAQIEGDRATPANNDEAYVSLLLSDSAGTQTEFGRLTWKGTTVTDTSEAGRLQFGVMTAGTLADELYLTGAALTPAANDGLALGTASLGFADLFLASGGVINAGNGEMLVTFSANSAAVTGGNFTVTDGTAATTAPVVSTNTNNAATVKGITIAGDRSGPANNDSVYAEFQLSDSAGNQDEFARIAAVATDVASGSEDGELRASVMIAGTLTSTVQISGTQMSFPVSGYGIAGNSILPITNAQVSVTHGAAAAIAPLRLVNSTDNASVQVAKLEGDRATMADNDEAYVSFLMSNDAGLQTEIARQTWVATDVNAGTSVDGRVDWSVMTAGSLAKEMQLDGVSLSPSTDAGLALGTTSLAWNGAHLNTGTSINWENGNLLLSHEANAGLVVDQGGNDLDVLQLRSSDVAHGVTSVATTTTFSTFRKQNPTAGGLGVWGIGSAALQQPLFLGAVGLTDATKSTAGIGLVNIQCYSNDGTATPATPGANANLLTLRSGGSSTRFILDADGDSHQDVGTAWTNFHGHDDMALVAALAANVTRLDDPIRADFHDFMFARREELERLKLVTYNDDGRHFVNMSKLTMLLVGAVQQIATKFDEIDAELKAAKEDRSTVGRFKKWGRNLLS